MDDHQANSSGELNFEIVRFINALLNKHGSDNKPELQHLFLSKCDYWFAVVLRRRFLREGAKIMFNRENIHFAVSIRCRIYDASGEVSSSGYCKWEDSEEFINNDPGIRRNKIELR